MLVPAREVNALARLLDERTGGLRIASVPTTVDPLDLVRAGAPLFASAHYFSTPGGDACSGLGVAWSCSAGGDDRFGLLERAFESAPDVPEHVRLFLGFSFAPDGPGTEVWDGFGAADLVLPRIAILPLGGVSRLLVACPPGVDPESTIAALRALRHPGQPPAPDPGPHSVSSQPSVVDYRSEVSDAVATIRAGDLDKVVLGRSVVVTAEAEYVPFDLVAHLSGAYRRCYIFGWQVGLAAFVGASPELLLDKHGATVRLNPLGGSASRGEGDDEDDRFGEALLASAKDRHEHALVVDDIQERLGPLTTKLVVPEEPTLRRTTAVQHLSTEVVGTLSQGTTPFELLDILHPTPAVGGTPRATALSLIDKLEGLDRGWYAGGIGWVTPSGDCRLALGLRCGLVRGGEARLFAGAGIVADSDPESELIETRLKLRPMLDLLSAR